MQGSGVYSESFWTVFDSITTANTRTPVGLVWVAWTRIANVTNYATVGSSIIGGTDIIAGSDVATINNADAFQYYDETDNVLRIEYERTLIEPLGGMSIAIADVVLDNTDLRFTPDHNATIGTALRPNRPMKIFIGFKVNGTDRVIPIIEGVTLQPREDKTSRTVTITAFDYLRWLNEKAQETAIYTNQRSDQIIADILARAGVGSSSYSLDQGLNTVGFAWFEKGDTAGERIRKLVEAEEGIFYQDETGILRFENRDKYSKVPFISNVWTIKPEDIIEWRQDYSNKIINRVIVAGSPRSVKDETEIWRDGVEEPLPAGATTTIWANFDDPASTITNPAATTDYTVFTGAAGTGTDITSDVSIVVTSFTKAAKLEISNANGSAGLMNFLRLRGTPATVDYQVKEVFQDTNSISDYNENQVQIENEFIDNKIFAASMAQNVVRRHRNPTENIILTVKGIPQLQLRDRIRIYDQDLVDRLGSNNYKDYRLLKIQGVLEGGGFIQKLYLRQVTSNEGL